MDLINLDNIPQLFKEDAERINELTKKLQTGHEKMIATCNHEFIPIKGFDHRYQPKKNSGTCSFEVIIYFKCLKCFCVKRIESPENQCHICGGKIEFQQQILLGCEIYNSFKCESCDHEYDS
ncbi:MAG: hypothetical protein WC666_03525 [Candidatus Paceibacterota bacterium]|jgi:hypothetical protein